jgi:uncharacterized protein (DUF4415 family)
MHAYMYNTDRIISAWRAKPQRKRYEADAEPFRDIDFSIARRGAVLPTEPGKTRITIRLDNAVLEHFRRQVEQAVRRYQTLINDALIAGGGHTHREQQKSILESVQAW